MKTTYAVVILLSLLSCLTTGVGVILALALRENVRAIAVGIGFSAGLMILIAVLELIPQSSAMMGAAATLVSAGAGAAALWAAHFIIPHTHLVAEARATDSALLKSAYLAIFGLILHDVPEGFAMANAYIASPGLGLFVAVAIALHNLPEEFAISMPAMALRSRRLLIRSALLSALAEPAGAILGLAAVGVAPALNACFLAFAAGAMFFVSIHELIPMARRYKSVRLFLSGVLLSALVYGLLASLTAGLIRMP